MQLKDIIKLLVVGFIAPLTYQLANNYIGNLPVPVEKWTEFCLWVVMAAFSLWRGRTYRATYVKKKALVR